jgi:hypothetical protein
MNWNYEARQESLCKTGERLRVSMPGGMTDLRLDLSFRAPIAKTAFWLDRDSPATASI